MNVLNKWWIESLNKEIENLSQKTEHMKKNQIL